MVFWGLSKTVEAAVWMKEVNQYSLCSAVIKEVNKIMFFAAFRKQGIRIF